MTKNNDMMNSKEVIKSKNGLDHSTLCGFHLSSLDGTTPTTVILSTSCAGLIAAKY